MKPYLSFGLGILVCGAASVAAAKQVHKPNETLRLLLDPRITTNERIDFLSTKNRGRVNVIIQDTRQSCAKVKDSEGNSSHVGSDFQTFMANMFVKQMCEPTSDVVDSQVRGKTDALAKVNGGEEAPDSPLVEAFSIMYSHSYLEAGMDPMTIPHLASARPADRERGLFHASPNSLVSHPELGRIMSEYVNRLHDLGEVLAKEPEKKSQVLTEYSQMCGTSFFMDDYKKEKTVNKNNFVSGNWEKNSEGKWQAYSDLKSEEAYGMTTYFKADPARNPSGSPMKATDNEILDTTFSSIQNVLNKPINKSCLETSSKLDSIYRNTFNAMKEKAFSQDIGDLAALGVPDLGRLDFNSVEKALEKTNVEIEKLTELRDDLSKKHEEKATRVDALEERHKREKANLGREKKKLDDKEHELVGSFGSSDESDQDRLLAATQNFAQTTSKTAAYLDIHNLIGQLVASTSQTSKGFGIEENFSQAVARRIKSYKYPFKNNNPVLFAEAPSGRVNELLVESLVKNYSQNVESQTITPDLPSLPYMKKHLDNYKNLHEVNQARVQMMLRQQELSSALATLGKDQGTFQTQFESEDSKLREKLKAEASRLYKAGRLNEKQFVALHNSTYAETLKLNAADLPPSVYNELNLHFALHESLGRRLTEIKGNIGHHTKLLTDNAAALEKNKSLYETQLNKTYDELLPELAANIDQSAIDKQQLTSTTQVFLDKSAEADKLRKRVASLGTSTKLTSLWLNTNKADLDSKASAETLRQLKSVQNQMLDLLNQRLEKLALVNIQLQKVRQDFRREIFSWKRESPQLKDSYWDINLMEGVSDHTPTNAAAACFATLQRFCPTFGVDYQATYLRFAGSHFGPINRGEVKPACVEMFNSLNSERSRLCSLK